MKKRRILVTIPRIPFPLNSGGRIAIYDTLKMLSNNYILTIIIIDDNKDNKKYLKEMSKFSDDIHFFTKPKIVFIFNSIWGLILGKPLQVGYFYFKSVQNKINQLAKKHDMFFAFMIRTSSYGIKLDIKKYHYAIDSMYLNYQNSQKKTTSLLWKFIYKIEVPLLFKIEKKHLKIYDITTFVSKEECNYWKKFGSAFLLPHGVNDEILEYDKFDQKYSNCITFIGRMDYQPNIEAVIWFCKFVLPKINRNIEFLIIGGYPTPEIIKLEQSHSNVKLLGFVEDPYLILKSSLCTVAPMRSGGGLQTKILVSMAVESLVLLTSQPSNAIEGKNHYQNLIIEDDPNVIAEIINNIYQFPSSYSEIRYNARELIKNNYSIKAIENKLLNLINNII